jgi:predicted RNA-binding Zn-ribbon protein involved in translation (DUF1610 family)
MKHIVKEVCPWCTGVITDHTWRHCPHCGEKITWTIKRKGGVDGKTEKD